jgi:predicted ABC-type sugar transport system permease subunit
MDPDVAAAILFVAYAFAVAGGIGAVLYATRTTKARDDAGARDGGSK